HRADLRVCPYCGDAPAIQHRVGALSKESVVAISDAPYNEVRKESLTMAKATVTSKGQITIPKTVRERLGLRPGDQIEFVEENGIFHIKKRVDEDSLAQWYGYLKHLKGQDVDALIEEMRGR